MLNFNNKTNKKTNDMNIKTFLGVSFMTTIISLSSCSTSEKTINYKEAQRYFVRNDIKDYSSRIITNAEELRQYFGMATVMGTQGMPAYIDFDKYNAIAIIEPATDKDTEIHIESIKKQGSRIVVRYQSVASGESRSYKSVPCLLVRIGKRYGDNVEFVKD